MDLQEMLYPLGLLASIAFGVRVVWQWYISEKSGQSLVTKGFWRLSLFGNCALALHSVIQLQLPMALIQTGHFVITLRNLNLMQPKHKHVPIQWVMVLFILFSCGTLVVFLASCYFFDTWTWMRSPSFLHGQSEEVNLLWKGIGLFGMLLFASRFWIQWVLAEKEDRSVLGVSFWLVSFFGAFFSVLYFIKIRDYVNVVSPLMGIVPYFRNLIFIKREQKV